MTASGAVSVLSGLSAAEVEERIRLGQVNRQPSQTSRTYSGIVRANVLTRFNLILSILAAVVLVVGELPDALFALVMVANTSIGIVQEVRAKWTLDRVRLLVSPIVTVRRHGDTFEVPPEQVVLGDLIEFGAGDQVAVDAEMLFGDGLEVDESALTGESDPVLKTPGDEVLSGSVVISGGALAVARRVGEDAGIHQLVEQAKAFELATSELRSGVDQVLRVVGWLIVPLGALLLWSQLRSNDSVDDALIAAVAGVIGLVPQGLILLVSMALAVAVIRLSKDHVVVQELHAVEGLARITMFCVDKTGTLTTGAMKVDSIELLGGAVEGDVEPAVEQALASLAAVDPNPNRTLRVIADSVAETATWAADHVVPFSSARKWSGATFRIGIDAAAPRTDSAATTWVLGAPEILLERISPSERPQIDASLEEATGRAQRVVLVATSAEGLTEHSLPLRLEPRALITLSEQVRGDAASTMAYFRQQGVTVKVISGDHPATVSAVAERIELPGAERCIDMRTVDIDDTHALDAIVARHVVFGRVLPDQKRAIVEALQRAGERVAMTGDGVNDIPALKRADIGVAVDTATPATKAVSQLVLLDGRFDRMPNVVNEGRRVIYNMERVSALFLTKTVYAALFAARDRPVRLGVPVPAAPDESRVRAHDRHPRIRTEFPQRRRSLSPRIPRAGTPVRGTGGGGDGCGDVGRVLVGALRHRRCDTRAVAVGVDAGARAVRVLDPGDADEADRPTRPRLARGDARRLCPGAPDRTAPRLLSARTAARRGPGDDARDGGGGHRRMGGRGGQPSSHQPRLTCRRVLGWTPDNVAVTAESVVRAHRRSDAMCVASARHDGARRSLGESRHRIEGNPVWTSC